MPTDLRQFDVIVLGAGAAGLMCAVVAGQRGRRVALLEHNGQPDGRFLFLAAAGAILRISAAAGKFSFRESAFCEIRAGALSAAHFSSWSSGTASPGTRRRWDNCFATDRRGQSSTCCWRSVSGRRGSCAECARDCGRGQLERFRVSSSHGEFGLSRWWWRPEVCRFRNWGNWAGV